MMSSFGVGQARFFGAMARFWQIARRYILIDLLAAYRWRRLRYGRSVAAVLRTDPQPGRGLT